MNRLIQGIIALTLFGSTLPSTAEVTNEFRIISIAPNALGQFTITWHSRPSDVFTIWYTEELSANTVWNVAEADYASQGYMTSWTDTSGQMLAATMQAPQRTTSLTKEQIEARRAELQAVAKAAMAKLMAEFEAAMARAKAAVAERLARKLRGEGGLLPLQAPEGGTALASSSSPVAGGRFYRISSPSWPSSLITAPSSGITVSGPLTVAATGGDDVGTVGAALLVDGIKLACDTKDSPYSFTLDTTTLANGQHELVVLTYDIDNHAGRSQIVKLQTDNLIYLAGVSAQAFTPDGDGMDETIAFSASFKENADWSLRIRNRSGMIVRTISGQGVQASVMWDGYDDFGAAVPMGTYEFSFVASPSGASGPAGSIGNAETQWRKLWAGRGAPNWNAINFHASHGVASGSLSQILRTYFFTYIGLAPLLFEPHPNIYVNQIRDWNSLLGYSGDIVPEFTVNEFFQNLRTDNLVYVMAHGAYDPNLQITVFVDFEDSEIGVTDVIRGAWEPYNPDGFIFVQMNFCQSADAIDAGGNNDLASGFGIFTTPLTVGRAYLGWRGAIRPTNSGLYVFDQTLWDNLTSGMNLEDAVADAWAQTIWAGADPVIVGDSNLILPDLL
jgi:hypothetical protein